MANYSFVWKMRQQAPSTNGTADLSTILELRLRPDEADSINVQDFAKSEYSDARWTEPITILQGEYNPALQQAVRDLLAKSAFNDLAAARAGPAFVVAAKARRLLAWFDATPTTQPVKVCYDADSEVYNFFDPATDEPIPRPAKAVPDTSLSWRALITPRLVLDALMGPCVGECSVFALRDRLPGFAIGFLLARRR